jgi:predicted AAA+ superfamily ATPase
MHRQVTENLRAWANASRRKPLIVRGARQVGKTWTIERFGREHFDGRVHTFDLERRRDLHRLFDDRLDPTRILSGLETVAGERITPGRDLLFLDEIQACPRAIESLRYFLEDLPELHVVAAGSLLEFALRAISVPVGRIQYLWMQPLTFVEYLRGVGNHPAADTVAEGPRPLGPTVHRALLDHLRDYLFVGGMPAAVSAYVSTGRLLDAFEVHDEIVTSYRDDFFKYQPRTDPDGLDDVLLAVAGSVGEQIKYARLSSRATSPTIKRAFGLLERAQLVRRVEAVRHVGLPLGARADPRFKAILVDVGLMQRLSGLPASVELARENLLGIHAGAVAEQFVGQQLATTLRGGERLHYWARGAKSSTAEVDYVVRIGDAVRPIEVKSGPSGRLRSLHRLLSEHPEVGPGIVLSEAPYAELPAQNLVFVPLYYAGALTGSAPGVT